MAGTHTSATLVDIPVRVAGSAPATVNLRVLDLGAARVRERRARRGARLDGAATVRAAMTLN